MRKRMMSANDVAIAKSERWFKPGEDNEHVIIGEQHL